MPNFILSASAGPGPEPVCVITACTWLRAGLEGLLTSPGRRDVRFLTAPDDGLIAAAGLSGAALVCHLPARLGSALDTLFFVAACLAPGRREAWRRIVLLTDLPPCWLFDVLHALTEDAAVAGGVEVVSLRKDVAVLQAVLTGDVLVPLSAQTRRLWRCALTAAELEVLRALLCRQQSFVAVARVRGTEINTIKAQKQTAFLKLRVRTWSGALNWRGDGF
ncbi:hypothetical protein [Serratia ureilytica]|uniref:hypothetical protein n=1 Tax=Serratia ureilytica TaxID=300181 RepID=UPI00313A9405